MGTYKMNLCSLLKTQNTFLVTSGNILSLGVLGWICDSFQLILQQVVAVANIQRSTKGYQQFHGKQMLWENLRWDIKIFFYPKTCNSIFAWTFWGILVLLFSIYERFTTISIFNMGHVFVIEDSRLNCFMGHQHPIG